jgi:hypothetical protein
MNRDKPVQTTGTKWRSRRPAAEAYRRQRLLDQINVDFAALRADREAWQAYRSDPAAWDSTLLNGLE